MTDQKAKAREIAARTVAKFVEIEGTKIKRVNAVKFYTYRLIMEAEQRRLKAQWDKDAEKAKWSKWQKDDEGKGGGAAA